MHRFILSITLIATTLLSALAYDVSRPPLSQPDDTTTFNRMLNLPGLERGKTGHNIAIFAESLMGHGKDNYYNTDTVARLRLNSTTFTPLSFINTTLALAKAYDSSTRPDWRAYANAFQELSCRRGTDNGFPSIMWHASDWIVDNIYRGNIKERTEQYSGMVEKTKSLDYMTRHRDEFAALKDSATYESVRMTEMGFRTHRIPVLKKETISKKEITEDLRDGDILILNPVEDGNDIYIIGIVAVRDDMPTLIYLDPDSGKITRWEEPLNRLFKLKTKRFNGYRWLRPQN